jgi:hypothetical protein
MRRIFPVAIICGLLAASPAAVAQRGGAGHFGGHAGGFAGGGFHGSFSAPRSFGGISGSMHFTQGSANHFEHHPFSQSVMSGTAAPMIAARIPAANEIHGFHHSFACT